MKPKIKYHTPTHKLIRQYEQTKNPVTKAVLREIIGKRIDRI